MREPVHISSVHNARVGKVLALRKQRERREAGCFLAEGVREVTRAHGAGLAVLELYHCPALLQRRADAAAIEPVRAAAELTFEVSEAVMKKLAYREDPEGVLAVVREPAWKAADLVRTQPTLVLVAVGIAKPGNLGAMARTVEAVGGGGVVLVDSVVDPYNPNAIRASTGAVFDVPCVAMTVDELDAWLTAHGVRCFAADPTGAVLYTAADLRESCALVIGAEDQGLAAAWLALAARHGGAAIQLPMFGRVTDSLNAATTAAVLLFEAVRQRSAKGNG